MKTLLRSPTITILHDTIEPIQFKPSHRLIKSRTYTSLLIHGISCSNPAPIVAGGGLLQEVPVILSYKVLRRDGLWQLILLRLESFRDRYENLAYSALESRKQLPRTVGSTADSTKRFFRQ